MAPQAAISAEPTIAEMEAELGQFQSRLVPLYVAQESANADATSYASAQRTTQGAALTDIILMREKCEAEVSRITREIAPLKDRADFLKRTITARKRAAQLAKMRQHAGTAVEHAPTIVDLTDRLVAALAPFLAEHRAVIGAANPDEQKGLRDDAANFAAVCDFILSRLATAGLPVRVPMGAGLSPVETATTTVTMVETLR